MLNCLLESIFLLLLIITAGTILIARDTFRHRKAVDSRTVSQRIIAIHDSAVFMVSQLQEHIRLHDPSPGPDHDRRVKILEFYQRLETLTCDHVDVERDEVERQANELSRQSSKYLQEHKLKGIFVALEADLLVRLIHQANAEAQNPLH